MPDPLNQQSDPSTPQIQPPPPPAPPPAPLSVQPQAIPDQDYSFITNPQAQPSRSLLGSLPGSNTVAGRVGVVAGLVLILLIFFLIIRAVLSGGGLDSTALISVAQDQQEMLHLVTNATEQQSLSSDTNLNFAATFQASVRSSQAQLFTYLANNKIKVKPQVLNQKVSTTTDQQLTAAKASGTYDQTFKQVMSEQLDTYGKDLVRAYQQDKGKKGRALLNDSYKQARLLATQLNSGN